MECDNQRCISVLNRDRTPNVGAGDGIAFEIGGVEGARSAPNGIPPHVDLLSNIKAMRRNFAGVPAWAPIYSCRVGRASQIGDALRKAGRGKQQRSILIREIVGGKNCGAQPHRRVSAATR